MSQQGPIIIVSTAQRPSFASALDDAKIFPIIDTGWADASRAIDELQPAAVLVATSEAVKADVETLAKRIASRQPYLPLLAIDPGIGLPENAIPFSQADGNFDRLVARLRAALRIRSLHATVMRRLDDPAARKTLADIDPAPRRHRTADRPRRRLPCAFRITRRANGGGRRALCRSRGETP